jgi:hypothetical protein
MHRPGFLLAAFTLWLASVAQPGAASSLSNGPAIMAGVPAPYNLRRTVDKNECFSHGGGAYCQDQSQLRQPVLIWEYNNMGAADGFRLYKVTGGRALEADIPTRVPQKITWAAWTAKMGTCFVVTAYAGSRESADSNKYCIPYVVQQAAPLAH